MKPNKKILDLIESGFSFKTLNKLSEKQLGQLHSRVVKEQTGVVTKEKKVKDIMIPSGTAKTTGADVEGLGVRTDDGGNIHITKTETAESKKPKKNSKNPWAICTSSLADEFGTSERSEWTKSQMKKYERCVMGVKEKMNEGKNPFEFILENKITQLIEKHVHPKMTKKDFLEVLTKKMIQETKTKEKEKEKINPPKKGPDIPYKPKKGPDTPPKGKKTKVEENGTKTKPTTKPGTKPTTKPSTPYSPKPGVNPAPKAGKKSVDEQGTKTKPGTKPTTKPGTKPSTPYSPKPGVNPAPKAKKGDIPDWFTFDKLGLKIK